VLKDSPNHAKVLQQLGWLYHQGGASFANQDLAISYLTKSLEAGESKDNFPSFRPGLLMHSIFQTPRTLKAGTF